VEKQSAHFYSVDITDKEAKMGLVCRVHSTAKSKFKVSCHTLASIFGIATYATFPLHYLLPFTCKLNVPSSLLTTFTM
jgi:hypothetical protein